MMSPSSSANRTLRPGNWSFANAYPASAEMAVAPAPLTTAYSAELNSHRRYSPSFWENSRDRLLMNALCEENHSGAEENSPELSLVDATASHQNGSRK